MSIKQDLNGVRTAADLERKYKLNEILGLKKAVEQSEIGLTEVKNDLNKFVFETLKDIEELQDQVDGNITTWFFSGVPTVENTPANEWKTEEDKINHLGDLYYDQDTGYCYRWTVIANIYQWFKLTDSDITEALALANAAQDTADSKRRVFVVQPIPPYDVGDIWFKEDSELYRCKRAKLKEDIFSLNDWIVATKYTDDTEALNAQSQLSDFKATVEKDYVTNVNFDKTTKGIEASVESTLQVAKDKNKTFTSEPTTPYYIGDAYIKDGLIYVCHTQRLEGNYNANDWKLDLNYSTKAELQIESNRISEVVKETTANTEIINNITTTKDTITGNNNLYIEDSLGNNALSYNIDGKCEQDGTPTPDSPVEIKTVKGIRNLFDTEYSNTALGLTNIMHNGQLKINGTTTGTGAVIADITGPYLKAGTYTCTFTYVSGDFTRNSKDMAYYLVNKNKNETIQLGGIAVANAKTRMITTFTLTEDTQMYIRFYTNGSGLVVDNLIYNIQIEEGSVSHDWVPCGVWLKTKVIGKNLFDKDNANILKGYIHQTKSTILTSTTDKMIYIPCKSNTTYTITKGLQTTTSKNRFKIATTNELPNIGVNIYNFVNGGSDGTTTKELTITTDDNSKYIVAFIYGNDSAMSLDELLSTIMIEESSTATKYEPYKEQEVLVDMNKPNLFDKNNINELKAWINNTNNLLTINQTTNSVIVNVKKNTNYTISKVASDKFRIGFYNSIPVCGETLANVKLNDTGNTIIANSGDNTYLVVYYYDNNSGSYTKQEILDSIKIYEGYDPYYELVSIGDIKDTLEVVSGVLTKRIGKVVLDGSENWMYSNNQFNIIGSGYLKYSNGGKCYSSHFKGSVYGTIGNDKEMWIGNSSFIVAIWNDITTVAEFKTWLSNNPVTVYYLLAEEETIELTPTNVPLFEVINNITLLEDLETNTSITYDRKTALSDSYYNKNEINAITTTTNEKVAEQVIKSDEIINRVSSVETTVTNNYVDINNRLNNFADSENVKKQINTIEAKLTSDEAKINVLNETIENGVTKVKTETGYTFDNNGLNINSSNAPVNNTLNAYGMDIKDNSSGENVLFAGYDTEIKETIVKTKNIKIEKYMNIPYARYEKYKDAALGDGTGCFFVE